MPTSSRNFSSAAVLEDEGNTNTASTTTNVNDINVKQAFTPTPERKYEFFQNVEITSDGIATIRFDNRDKKVNTISFNLKDEAEKLWQEEIHSNPDVRAVIFVSTKPDTFIAGADIFDIQSMVNKEDIIPLIESAQNSSTI